jgi:probable selenium-dependent hydroxylase accessory protein YqeC
MTASNNSLLDALGLHDACMVSIVGGGGKSTVMGSLQAELMERGSPVFATTTTRIHAPREGVLLLGESAPKLPAAISAALVTGEAVTVGERRLDNGKLAGLDPETLCGLRRALPSVWALCEADGSKGRPLKVHAAHEPVIPACTDHLLVVAGLWALGQPVSADTIHRIELLDSAGVGETITPEFVAGVLLCIDSRCRYTGARTILLNGADRIPREEALQVAELVAGAGRRVLITSRGEPVEEVASGARHG